MNINELEKLENEEWKLHPIGVYVSNKGRVFIPQGKRGRKTHYTFGSNGTKGYKGTFHNNKRYKVHRLVAECFIPNPNNYPTVDHINRNTSDNRVENLRWATYSMQCENRGNSKQVAQINPSTNEIIRIYPSITECYRNGFNQGAISNCCNNKFNRIGNNIYKGYKWQYVA